MHERTPERRDEVSAETAGEYTEGKLRDETFGGSRRWGGYGSDAPDPAPAASPDDRPRDLAIHDRIYGNFSAREDLDARDVDVNVTGGEVTLQGTVASDTQRRLAERLAREVPGVRAVRNHLGLRIGELLPPEKRRPSA